MASATTRDAMGSPSSTRNLIPMSDHFQKRQAYINSASHTPPILMEDPYKSTRLLGSGGGGFVDEVFKIADPHSGCYARKRVYRHGSLVNRRFLTEQLVKEAKVIQQLRHKHIVEVVEVYAQNDQFSIVMLPVAETDLGKYLELVDSTEFGPKRDEARFGMSRWPGCLIRALDYLHEMGVIHRDIKPSNILIKAKRVFITDFGISIIRSDGETTGDSVTAGPVTRLYAPPEKLLAGSRRGRKADIFALGCVLLEISTAIIGAPGAQGRFNHFRLEKSGTRSYADNSSAVLQWIWYLYAIELAQNKANGFGRPADEPAAHANSILDFAFVMLDPNVEQRATARQLVAMISAPRLGYLDGFNKFNCSHCHRFASFEDRNVPIHSIFRLTLNLGCPEDPEAALNRLYPYDWEVTKSRWLEYHMWWPVANLALSSAESIDEALIRSPIQAQ